MTKRITSFLFLAAATLLFFEIFPIISDFSDLTSAPEGTTFYHIGHYIGVIARIIFHLGLSVYFLISFWRQLKINH